MNQITVLANQTAITAADQLVDQAREYFDAADAQNTTRAYAAAWKHFTGWCAAQGVEALPVPAPALALYLTSCARQAKVATIQQRLAAISRKHKEAGHVTPTQDQVVRQVWRGIRRAQGVAQVKKAPVLTVDVQHMVEAAGDGLRGLRDRALIVAGFAGGFRRSELVAFQVEDVVFAREGAVLTVRRSKTDQEGAGARVALPYGSNPATCPVRALQDWLHGAQLTTGPLFRSIHRGGMVREALTGHAVAGIVKRLAAAAGLDPAHYAGHSLRAGLVTQAAISGVAEHQIARQSRHKSVAVLRGYIRDSDLFARNAAGALGL
jgi:site-specific recombinase XerD